VALASAQNKAKSEAELKAVREQVKTLEAKIRRETTDREENAKALRAAELEVAAASSKLTKLRADLGRERGERRELAEQVTSANARLAAERAALAEQVRLNYMTGREELFKLLLSQESPASLGRMLVYYDYYNRARSARIDAVETEVRTLAELERATSAVERELASLEAEQATQVAAQRKSRDDRQAALAALDASLRDDSARVQKLRGEERRLRDLVDRLNDALANFPVDSDQPFDRLKGKLAWPVDGRLAGDFGQPRGSGGVTWNGVLLEAPSGTPVRAVYHGRVAFADWLPGLGLLIILDHGGGYMSLYGHNEALLKEPGDWVDPGEPIASVGDTGGQLVSGLYFEIRRNGEAVNPHPWIAKRGAR
jgi:septal ring factor EnvC (AmiA/AmiB activator)